MTQSIASPTLGHPDGTLVTVRGYLIGHGPKGRPCIAFRDPDGALTPLWLNAAEILKVEAAPAERDGLRLHIQGEPFAPPQLVPHRFGVHDELDRVNPLQGGFPSIRMAARWAAEMHPDALIRLDLETARQLSRHPSDLS